MVEPGRYSTQERDWVRDAAAHDQADQRFQDELREPRIPDWPVSERGYENEEGRWW